MARGTLPRRGYAGLLLATGSLPGGGLLVRGVAPGSSAAAAGVRAGDVLMHLNGEPSRDLVTVREHLRGLPAGGTLTLGVVRDGQPAVFTTTVAPFPLEAYSEARVELGEVPVDGHRLRSLAVLPRSEGPHPVVYWLPGAHWASDEYPLNPEHPTRAFLAELAAAGIASVRVERSGVGDSEGPPCTRVDFQTELRGYRAGFDHIIGQNWVDPDRVYLFGHSLGAMVAPLLAREVRCAALVLFAAGAVPISKALIDAVYRHMQANGGLTDTARAHADRLAELIRLVVCDGKMPGDVFAARPDLAAIAPGHYTMDQAYHRVVTFYHQLERVDFAAVWGAVKSPTLLLHGDRDWITAPDDSRRVQRLAGGPTEFRELPRVDHYMSDAPDGTPATLAESLVAATLDWISRHH